MLQHFKEKNEDSNEYSKYRCSLIQGSPELAQLTFSTRSVFEVRVCPVLVECLQHPWHLSSSQYVTAIKDSGHC